MTSHGSTSSAPLTEPCHTLHRAGILSRFLRALCPCAGSPSSPLKPSLALFKHVQTTIHLMWTSPFCLPEDNFQPMFIWMELTNCALCARRETISDCDQALLETRGSASYARMAKNSDSEWIPLVMLFPILFFFIPFFPIISIISLFVLSFFFIFSSVFK